MGRDGGEIRVLDHLAGAGLNQRHAAAQERLRALLGQVKQRTFAVHVFGVLHPVDVGDGHVTVGRPRNVRDGRPGDAQEHAVGEHRVERVGVDRSRGLHRAQIGAVTQGSVHVRFGERPGCVLRHGNEKEISGVVHDRVRHPTQQQRRGVVRRDHALAGEEQTVLRGDLDASDRAALDCRDGFDIAELRCSLPFGRNPRQMAPEAEQVPRPERPRVQAIARSPTRQGILTLAHREAEGTNEFRKIVSQLFVNKLNGDLSLRRDVTVSVKQPLHQRQALFSRGPFVHRRYVLVIQQTDRLQQIPKATFERFDAGSSDIN